MISGMSHIPYDRTNLWRLSTGSVGWYFSRLPGSSAWFFSSVFLFKRGRLNHTLIRWDGCPQLESGMSCDGDIIPTLSLSPHLPDAFAFSVEIGAWLIVRDLSLIADLRWLEKGYTVIWHWNKKKSYCLHSSTESQGNRAWGINFILIKQIFVIGGGWSAK